MHLFPRIDSPCPLRWKILPSAERNFCTLCERKVYNLDRMNIEQRKAFLATRSEATCVAYSVPRRQSRAPIAAGLGLAAALSLGPAMAGEAPTGMPSVQQVNAVPAEAKAGYEAAQTLSMDEEILVGSVRDPRDAEWELDDANSELPEIPRREADAFLGDAEFIAAPDSSASR